jgi:hypothetical protein
LAFLARRNPQFEKVPIVEKFAQAVKDFNYGNTEFQSEGG